MTTLNHEPDESGEAVEPLTPWQTEAIERLPQHTAFIYGAYTPLDFWAGLWALFVRAHQEPKDRATIGGIYQFAEWCIAQDEDEDLTQITIMDFYEDLAREPSVWEDIPRYMTREQFKGMEGVYKYGLSDEEHTAFMNRILERYKSIAKRERRHEQVIKVSKARWKK